MRVDRAAPPEICALLPASHPRPHQSVPPNRVSVAHSRKRSLRQGQLTMQRTLAGQTESERRGSESAKASKTRRIELRPNSCLLSTMSVSRARDRAGGSPLMPGCSLRDKFREQWKQRGRRPQRSEGRLSQRLTEGLAQSQRAETAEAIQRGHVVGPIAKPFAPCLGLRESTVIREMRECRQRE